jgi:hypothetical protein
VDIDVFKPTLWSQFGASIDMIEESITACTDGLWARPERKPQFWYTVFHALFWLDRYLSRTAEGFTPPAPFTLMELDPGGTLPERVYTKAELQSYAAHCREKCISTLEVLTDEVALERCAFKRLNMTVLELHIYNLRHAQHHAGQLTLMVREDLDLGVPWVTKSKS